MISICAISNGKPTKGTRSIAALFTVVEKTPNQDLIYFFVNNSFVVNSLAEKKSTGLIQLDKSNLYRGDSLNLYLPHDQIEFFFPRKTNSLGDDCYQIELMNMLSKGKLLAVKSGDTIRINKSSLFKFHIGPRMLSE